MCCTCSDSSLPSASTTDDMPDICDAACNDVIDIIDGAYTCIQSVSQAT